MRVDVVKVLFMGIEKEREIFFTLAQDKGVIEFIHPRRLKSSMHDAEAHKLIAAIKVLRGLVPVEQLEGVSSERILPVAEKILYTHAHILKLQEELRLLTAEISRIDIFGNFSLDDISYIERYGHCKVQFFYRIEKLSDVDEECFHELIPVGIDNGMEYFVSIHPEPVSYKKLIEIKITRPLEELKERLTQAKAEIHFLEHELKEMGRYNQAIHHEMLRRYNWINYRGALECVQTVEKGAIFAVEGWVPSSKLSEVGQFCDQMNVYHEEILIEPADVIPTCLENENTERIGEDLVHIYDTPSITDNDPSPWVLWAFLLFFAMIINDAGYGTLFLLGTLWSYHKMPKLTGLAKRMRKLALMLSVACVIWGTLTTSFFGIEVSLDNPIRKVSFVDWLVEKKAEFHFKHHDDVYQEWVNDFPQLANVKTADQFLNIIKDDKYPIRENFNGSVMFEFALLLGTVHVILSILRNLRRNWSGAGWIIFIVGAWLYLPVMLHSTSMLHYAFGLSKAAGADIGIQMIYIGMGAAVVLALVHKKLGGCLEVMTVIQIFCDILSYLRLYALGLAGMMMGATFNDMASGTNIVFGTIIVLIGHTINIAIGIMGGVIHGLRLNFLEWYHYSFEGGGRMFKPLALLGRAQK